MTGARGGALVLSSAPIAVPCRACDGWNEFVLEDYASGPALVRRFAARRGVRLAGAEDVLAAAASGDVAAAEIVASAAAALGSAIAWLVNVLDPHGVVIGGGLGLAPGLVPGSRDFRRARPRLESGSPRPPHRAGGAGRRRRADRRGVDGRPDRRTCAFRR